MYLSDKANGHPRDVSNHQTAELLLEYCETLSLSDSRGLTRDTDTIVIRRETT